MMKERNRPQCACLREIRWPWLNCQVTYPSWFFIFSYLLFGHCQSQNCLRSSPFFQLQQTEHGGWWLLLYGTWSIHIILPKVPRHQCTRGSLNWKRYSPARLWWPGRGRVHPGLWTVTSERCSDWNSGSSCHRPSMTSSQIFGAVPQGFGDVWMGCSTSLSSVNKMLIFSQFCTNACFPYNWYIVTLYIRSFGIAQTRHRCLGLGLYLIHVL